MADSHRSARPRALLLTARARCRSFYFGARAALADGERALLALFDVASGRQRILLHAHHRTVHELSWSADGSRLVFPTASPERAGGSQSPWTKEELPA